MIKKKYLSLLAALTAIILVITGCGSDSEPTSGKTTKNSETEVSSTVTPDDKESDNTESETDNTETDNTDSETETDNTANNDTRPSIEEIERICSTRATCETDINACIIDITSDNPYDVIWDYGEEYDNLVAMCDWSLVWDYDFYVEAFPELAELYHYDKDLLLRHFQTVGVHEGRQGRKEFYAASTAEHNYISYNNYSHDNITDKEITSDDYGIAHVYFIYMLYPENFERIQGNPYSDDHIYKPHYTKLQRDVISNYSTYCHMNMSYVLSLTAYENIKNNKDNNLTTLKTKLLDKYDFIAEKYTSTANIEYDFVLLNISDTELTTDVLLTPVNELSDMSKDRINDLFTHRWTSSNISNIYYNPDTGMYYCIRMHF